MSQEPPAPTLTSTALGMGTSHDSSSSMACRHDWYVVVGVDPVGPMDLTEVERYWDAMAIDAGTRVWRQPMPEWTSLSDVEELAHLPATRPQPMGGTGGSGKLEGWGQVCSGHEPTVQVGSLRGGHPTGPIEGASLPWGSAPSDALGTATARADGHASAAFALDVSGDDVATLPPQAAAELFQHPALAAGGFLGPNVAQSAAGPAAGYPATSSDCATVVPGFGAALPNDAPAAWSLPAERRGVPQAVSGNLLLVVMGLVGVSVVSALGGVALIRWKTGAGGPGSGTATLASQTPTTPGVAAQASLAGGGVASLLGATAEPSGAEQRQAPATSRRSQPSARKRQAVRAHRSASTARTGRSASRSATRNRTAKRDAVSMEAVVSTVQRQARTLAPCFQQALERGEIRPGSHRLLLDWVIKPSGHVRSARLGGPAELARTSLASCVPGVMQRWRFPASQNGTPVRNFPLGPVTIR